KVAIADIQEEVANATAQELRAAGYAAVAVKLDVTSLASAQAAAEKVAQEFGGIDVLVNNAGWDKLEPFVESTPETWDKVIAINFRGVIHCCKAAIPRLQSRGGGKIVSIARTRVESARWARRSIPAARARLSRSRKPWPASSRATISTSTSSARDRRKTPSCTA